MGAIIPLLFQYGPQILQAILGVQHIAAQAATKVTGQQKLEAAKSAIVTIAPAILDAINTTPEHAMHLDDYINMGVKALNATNSWADADAHLNITHGPLPDAVKADIASQFAVSTQA